MIVKKTELNTFAEQRAALEAYARTGKGLSDVMTLVGRLLLNANEIDDLIDIRGYLACHQSALEALGIDTHEAKQLDESIEQLLRDLEEKEAFKQIMWERERINNLESMMHEELALAAQELGVTTSELPPWVFYEIRLRYGQLPLRLQAYTEQARAEFDSQNSKLT